jgi:hypothetical protein
LKIAREIYEEERVYTINGVQSCVASLQPYTLLSVIFRYAFYKAICQVEFGKVFAPWGLIDLLFKPKNPAIFSVSKRIKQNTGFVLSRNNQWMQMSHFNHSGFLFLQNVSLCHKNLPNLSRFIRGTISVYSEGILGCFCVFFWRDRSRKKDTRQRTMY